jgi:hypothetical protein
MAMRPSHSGTLNSVSDLGEKNAIGKDLIPGLDCNKPAICLKRHHIHLPQDNWTGQESFILIVRDFKECILKHLPPGKQTHDRFKIDVREYVRLLKFYDTYSGPKMLIYYEDLMNYPGRELLRVKNFWDLDSDRYNAFMNNYKKHKEIMLEQYHGKKVHLSSRGERLKFHQNMAKQSKLNHLNNEARSYADIYIKYLKRYK